jgi:signal transduction histidine kinase
LGDYPRVIPRNFRYGFTVTRPFAVFFVSSKIERPSAHTPAQLNSSLRKEIARRQAVEQALLESRSRQVQLRRVARQALSRQEKERLQISRRLQEEIAQSIAGINFHLAAIQTELPGAGPAMKTRIHHAKQMVEDSVSSVQRFARDLRPTLLDDLGLIPALRTYLHAFGKRHGRRVTFSAQAEVEELTRARRTALFRLAQAALAHLGGPDRSGVAALRLERSPGEVCMTISDRCATAPKRRQRPTEIVSMRERAEMVGGTFRLRSIPGAGTTIEACMPIGRARSAALRARKKDSPAS